MESLESFSWTYFMDENHDPADLSDMFKVNKFRFRT